MTETQTTQTSRPAWRIEPPTLKTDRLILRPYRLSDAAELRRLIGEYEVARTLATVPHPYPYGEAERFIAGRRAAFGAGKSVELAVTLAAGELIGGIGLRLNAQHGGAELGYWIGRPFWRRGYATEAAGAMLDYGFAQLGLRRIAARHFGSNPASGRVMVKIGMKCEGTMRQALLKWGRVEDDVCYGILADEWAQRRLECGQDCGMTGL